MNEAEVKLRHRRFARDGHAAQASQEAKREEAMSILEELCRKLNSLTADIFYSALDEAHFNEEERVQLVGACFRTAQARRWIERTTFSAKSRRNHSNLLSVWVSNIFGVDRQGQTIGQSEIGAEYAKWRRVGLEPPDREAKLWRWQREAMASWEQGTGGIPGNPIARN